MKPLLLFLGVLALVGLQAAAGAATLYVAPSGSDSAPGTTAQPFQTISKAAQIAKAGDTVIVRAGVYRESVSLRTSGTAGKPITFEAQPPGSVVVTGADPITGWTRVPGDAPIYQVPWNHVFAIDFRDGKPIEAHPEDEPLWGRAEQVIADGRQLLPTLGLDGLTKAWQAHTAAGSPAVVPPPLPHLGGPFGGCFAVDTAQKLLYVWLADGSNPAAHAMQASTRGLIFGEDPWADPPGVQYVDVKGFVFRYGATFPQRAAVWLHGAHNAMQDCIIEDMSGSGVDVDGSLTGCVVRGCGQTGGSATGDGFVNENDLWEDNCWKPIDRGWDAGGVKQGATKNGLFQHCVFRRNGGPGLWLDVWVHDVRITQCVFQNNEESGVFVEISHHIQVDHNLVLGNATGAVGKDDGWANDGITLAESEDCQVTNNTCVGNKVGIGFREQGPRPNETDTGHIDFHDTRDVVTNNICADNAQYQLALWYDNPFFGPHPSELKKYPTAADYDAYVKTIPDRVYDPTKESLTIRDNLYAPSTTQATLILYGVPWRPKHQEYASVAAWTAATKFGAGSRAADPEFINAAKNDFQMGKHSPARQMQAGWADAPTDINHWIDAVLSPWVTANQSLQERISP